MPPEQPYILEQEQPQLHDASDCCVALHLGWCVSAHFIVRRKCACVCPQSALTRIVVCDGGVNAAAHSAIYTAKYGLTVAQRAARHRAICRRSGTQKMLATCLQS